MVNWHELAGVHGFFEPGCDFSTEDLAVPSEELFVSDSAVDLVTTLFSSFFIIFHYFSSFLHHFCIIFHYFSSFLHHFCIIFASFSIIFHQFSSCFIMFHHFSSFFMCSPGLTLLRLSQEFPSTSQFWFVFLGPEKHAPKAPGSGLLRTLVRVQRYQATSHHNMQLWSDCKFL